MNAQLINPCQMQPHTVKKQFTCFAADSQWKNWTELDKMQAASHKRSVKLVIGMVVTNIK
jgi:hypothetical protein